MHLYAKCSIEELQKFVKDRKTAGGLTTEKRRPAIIAVLLSADETRTFTRFTDLPPELRGRIYTIHFASLALTPTATSFTIPPPITYASRLLHTESFPQFLSETRFYLTMIRYEPCSCAQISKAWKFFVSAPKEHIAMVKKLRVVVCCRQTWNAPKGHNFGQSVWDLDFAVGDKKGLVSRVLQDTGKHAPPESFEEPREKGTVEILEEGLRRKVQSIGAGKLTRKNVLDVVEFLVRL